MTDEKPVNTDGNERKPRYLHACPRCIFLGQHGDVDLYGCVNHEIVGGTALYLTVEYADGTDRTVHEKLVTQHGLAPAEHCEAWKRWNRRETVRDLLRFMPYGTTPAQLRAITESPPMIRLDQHGNLVGWRCQDCGALNNPALPQCLCGGKTKEV